MPDNLLPLATSRKLARGWWGGGVALALNEFPPSPDLESQRYLPPHYPNLVALIEIVSHLYSAKDMTSDIFAVHSVISSPCH